MLSSCQSHSSCVIGPYPRAAVPQANHFQFTSALHIHHPCVQSRVLLWCLDGRGEVGVNGSNLPMIPGTFLLLPWGHEIWYHPDSREPFRVGCVHLIPDHAPEVPLTFGVAHKPEDPLWNAAWRRDAALPGWEGLLAGSTTSVPALMLLAEYTIAWYQREVLQHQPRSGAQDSEARLLGALVLQEILRYARTASPHETPLPERLHQVQQFVRAHLAARLAWKISPSRPGAAPPRSRACFALLAASRPCNGWRSSACTVPPTC